MIFFTKRNIVFIFFTILTLTISAEIYLRYFFFSEKDLVFPFGKKTINRSQIKDGYGITNATFSTNRMGLRAKHLMPHHNPRILLIGSSTLVGFLLDNQETVSHFLEKKLRPTKKNSWVGIGSQSGNNIVENHLQLKSLIKLVQPLDMVFVMAGGIDMLLRVSKGEFYQPNFLQNETDHQIAKKYAFSEQLPDFNIKNSALFYFLRQSKKTPDKRANPDMLFFPRSRKYRQESKNFIDQSIDLSLGLDEFEFHQRKMIKIAQESRVQIVFLTQPFLWKNKMTPDEINTLWMGFKDTYADSFPWGKPFDTFYSIPILLKMAREYEDRMKSTCLELNVPFIDISKLIPRNNEYFIDDAHITPLGSEFIADEIFEYIQRSKKP